MTCSGTGIQCETKTSLFGGQSVLSREGAWVSREKVRRTPARESRERPIRFQQQAHHSERRLTLSISRSLSISPFFTPTTVSMASAFCGLPKTGTKRRPTRERKNDEKERRKRRQVGRRASWRILNLVMTYEPTRGTPFAFRSLLVTTVVSSGRFGRWRVPTTKHSLWLSRTLSKSPKPCICSQPISNPNGIQKSWPVVGRWS